MYYVVTNTDTEDILISNIKISAGEGRNVTSAFVKTHWNQFSALVDAGLITMESTGDDESSSEDADVDMGTTYERMVVEFENGHDNPIEISHERGIFPIVQVYGKLGGDEAYQLVDENVTGGYGSGLASNVNSDVIQVDSDTVHIYLTNLDEGVIVLLF